MTFFKPCIKDLNITSVFDNINIDNNLSSFSDLNDYKLIQVLKLQKSYEEVPRIILEYKDDYLIKISDVSIVIQTQKNYFNYKKLYLILTDIYSILTNIMNIIEERLNISLKLKFSGVICNCFFISRTNPINIPNCKEFFLIYLDEDIYNNSYNIALKLSKIIDNKLFFNLGLEVLRIWNKNFYGLSEDDIKEQGLMISLEINDRYTFNNFTSSSIDNELYSVVSKSWTIFSLEIDRINAILNS